MKKDKKETKSNKQQAEELAEQAKLAFGSEDKSEAENSGEENGPKIEMQGVSGKIITGVVKLVKRKANKEENADKAAVPPEEETAAAAGTPAAPVELASQAEQSRALSPEPAPAPRAEQEPAPQKSEPKVDRDLPGVHRDAKIGLVKPASKESEEVPAPRPAATAERVPEREPQQLKPEATPPVEAQAAQVETASPEAKKADLPLETKMPKASQEQSAESKKAEAKAPQSASPKQPKREQKSEDVAAETAQEARREAAPAAKAEAPVEAEPQEQPLTSREEPAASQQESKLSQVEPAAPAPVQAKPVPGAIQAIVPPGKEVKGSRDLPVTSAPIRPGLVSPSAGSGKVVVDTGIRRSSYQGPIIRPQEGSYVGRDADKPIFEKRRYNPGRPQGGRTGARGPGRPRPDNFVQDKDKDDDKPRFNQKRRAPKRRTTEAVVPEVNKDQGRRSFEQKRQQSQRRTEADWKQHHQAKERSFEQELLRESRRRRQQKKAEQKGSRAVLTQVKLPESLTVKELAELLKKTSAEVITKLMGYGVMATLNQEIDYDTAEIIAGEFGIKAELEKKVTEEDILFDDSEDKDEDLVTRPPVVVVMGHVDHGKTSILDYIREAHVTSAEAGGITQHIGAYTVDLNGRQITFLDTPGHEAFTAMRARGAQVTDIAILVVAADDGVMPQTVEAINHARQAGTRIIVAINKIDKDTANVDRVKQELTAHNILSPEWGGDIEMVPVSAKTGQGMDELLEMVLLTADVLELKANPNRQAKGTVIEAYLDRGRGPVATVLVQRGTLHQGDMVVVGPYFGNVRAMSNDRGQMIEAAGPSVPVEILGLPDVPEGGEIFYQVENEKVARSLAERRQQEERELALSRKSHVSLDNLFSRLAEGEVQDLNIIVKADVQGSVEAVKQSLEKLSNKEVRLQVIHGTVGAITESDVRLAEVSEAIIIGFNVRPPAAVAKMAEEVGVDIRLYQVIYDAIEDMEKAMQGLLAPEFQDFVLGHAEVRETYKVSGIGMIAGCFVTDGVVQRKNKVRCLRDNIVLHDGELASLRRFKDDVREVKEGYECGMSIERFNDIRVGDVFEFYEVREVERTEPRD